MRNVDEFIEQFQDQVEVAKAFIEEAIIEGEISADTTTLMELMTEMIDELDSLTDESDEEE